MDAVYFGTLCWFAPCNGSGPWVQADLENGLFGGGNGNNPSNAGNKSAFVTALVRTTAPRPTRSRAATRIRAG